MLTGDPYTFSNQSAVDPKLLKPILQLFRSWDDSHSDDSYLNSYSADATLLLGPSPAKGREAIKALRESMINAETGPIIQLQHQLDKVFVLAGSESAAEKEVVMNGTIFYILKNGKRIDADWASWVIMSDRGGDMEMTYYKVYTDSSALMAGIGEMMAATNGLS